MNTQTGLKVGVAPLGYALIVECTDPKTLGEVRAEFARKGVSVASWAKKHGFSRQMAHAVLSGRLKCNYGVAHRIAVLLGIKEGEIA